MKKLLLCLFLALVSCVPAKPLEGTSQAPQQYKEVLARVTYYWGDTITSRGTKPVCGRTLAVDPKIIPYESKVYIPKMDKTFIARDTGSAVKSRLAARKLGKPECIVVDVFCSSKAVAQRRIKKYPMFMKIRILK